MPFLRLGTEPVEVRQFAVVGTCPGSWVKHVGLLAHDMMLSAGESANAFHMVGPRALGLGLGLRTDISGVSVVSWLDDLSEDERRDLNDWIEVLRPQLSSVDYWILQDPVSDEITRRLIHRRYSCASFVTQAFLEGANIRLIEDGSLPQVGRSELSEIWDPRFIKLASRFGLVGDGPWPILLPGYVLRAVAAGRSALPFRPSLVDAGV